MLDGQTIVAGKQAAQEINENTVGFVVGIMDQNGKTTLVSGGDIGALSFLKVSFDSLLSQIVEGRDPRGKMPIGLRPVE